MTGTEIINELFPDSFLVFDQKGKIIQSRIGRKERAVIIKPEHLPEEKKTQTVLNAGIARKIKEKLKDNSGGKKPFSFEIEITAGNRREWFEVRITRIDPNSIFATIRNITELLSKVNEIEKFYNITEQSQELVMITDVTGTIEYVNPMLTKTTGYTRSEVVGKKANIFKSEKHPDAFHVNIWRTILKGKAVKTEFINARKNGTFYIEEKIITPLLNVNGEITNFISMGRDVTLERRIEQKANKYKQLEVTILEKEQKSRTLSLIKSNEHERKKFAREIHEGINQMLSAAMANLESLGAKKLIHPEEKTKIEFINQMVFEITQDLRGISTNLSPMTLYEFGLFPVIQQIVRKTDKTNDPLNINLSSNIAGMRFKSEIEINIYRIVQEAIKNIVAHSQAKKILLNLNYENNVLTLQIKDNGLGINPNNLEFKKMSTFGILNMEARAKSIGALFTIKSGKDKGFEINLSVNAKLKNND
ncbi:MAG: PAS domain S-box protein [Bacteroidota bacterium]